MSSQRNIVILGGSFGGLLSAHYVLKHILPALKEKKDGHKYHVLLISQSSDFYFRIASPRTSASNDLLPAEKIVFDIKKHFEKYSSSDFTFIQASAKSLDTTSRKVHYSRSDYLSDESVEYHALVVATGSNTHQPVYSMHTDTAALLNEIKAMNSKVKNAKDIIVVGGGATGVESAGELGELLNGKPGWFSTPTRKVNITLITAADRLLPTVRADIGKAAEKKLNKAGVDVLYATRVANVQQVAGGRTKVMLAKGDSLETDLYIPANGVLPNSSWLPSELLDDYGYLNTNAQTLRVDNAGPRVYSIGDVASYSRNTVMEIYDSMPSLAVNMERDLLSFDAKFPDQQPRGKDRLYKRNEKDTIIVPIGSGGGVGILFGWKAPNWAVWLIKARDFMVGIGPGPIVSGDKVKGRYKLTAEESY